MKNFDDAKILCENEKIDNKEKEKFFEDEQKLQEIDLDYDTIHSEILENIILDENDSGISDLETTEKYCSKKRIFEIYKIKAIIHKSVKSFFNECQEDDQFKPLIQQEKHINKLTKEYKKDNNELLTNINENKTKENTKDSLEIKIENVSLNNTIDIKSEKQPEIINYKKYNYFNDPNSNYNNFTNKYIIKTNVNKRFRDIHPFLKTFNPKFLKKENIDKKLFRKFRKFVKSLYKENLNSEIFKKNSEFWKKFYVKNLLPPVSIVGNDGKTIVYKSFNSRYLIWLFGQEGATELFKLFIEKESEKIIKDFIDIYKLKEDKEPGEIEQLKQYIKYIPEIYGEFKDKNDIALKENDEINKNKFDEENNDDILDSENGYSNPFKINFNFIGRKQFKEFSYDDNDNYFKGENNLNSFSEVDIKSERFGLDNSFNIDY